MDSSKCELFVPDSSSGAIKHYQRGQTPCEDCKTARARYLRIWRATSMTYIQNERRKSVKRLFDPDKMEKEIRWMKFQEKWYRALRSGEDPGEATQGMSGLFSVNADT